MVMKIKMIAKNNEGEIVIFDDVWCWSQNLEEIISIPHSFSALIAFNNKLTSLPKLPEGLTKLDCERNQLMSLPELPKFLKYLVCDNNNITKLPDLRELKNIELVNCDMCCFETYMVEMKNVKFQFYC